MGPWVKPENDAADVAASRHSPLWSLLLLLLWRSRLMPAMAEAARLCRILLSVGFRLLASLSSSSPATVVVAIAADLHRPARAVQCADAPYSGTTSSYAPSSRTRSSSSGLTRGPMPNPGNRLPPRGHGLRRAAATAAPPDNPRRIRHTPHRPSPRACARNTRRQRRTPPRATPLDRHQSAGPSPLPHHPHPAIATA